MLTVSEKTTGSPSPAQVDEELTSLPERLGQYGATIAITSPDPTRTRWIWTAPLDDG